jgi:hypothetical protein
MYRQRVPMGIGQRLTPLVKKLLIGLVVLYLAQVVLESWLGLPVSALVALWAPLSTQGLTGMFRIWQPVSALLFNGHPQAALFDWLMLYFFLGSTLDFLGRKGTAKFLASVWVAGALVAMLLVALGIAHPGTSLGLTALTSAMVVAYGMAQPNAQILIFFVLPMKGRTFVIFDVAIATLYFLYERSFDASIILFASLAAIVWMWSGGSAQQLWLKARLSWLTRQRGPSGSRRFEVIEGGREGGRGGDDRWVH